MALFDFLQQFTEPFVCKVCILTALQDKGAKAQLLACVTAS